jgi:Rrf2 family protein
MSYSQSFSNAILTTVFIADKVQQGVFDFITTKEICSSLGLAAPTTTKILQALNKAGIIEIREGAKGGVRLSLSYDQVSILHIFDAIEHQKPPFQANYNISATGKRPEKVQLEVQALFKRTNEKMRSELASLSIADLINKIDD